MTEKLIFAIISLHIPFSWRIRALFLYTAGTRRNDAVPGGTSCCSQSY